MRNRHLHLLNRSARPRGALLALLLALLIFLTGCPNAGSEESSASPSPTGSLSSSFDALMHELNSTISEAKKAVDELTPSEETLTTATREEVRKLHSWEYRVIEVPADSTKDAIEAKLRDLGADRWDCFEVIPHEEELRLFCKRHPKTYLRYIPRVFP